MTSKLEIYTEVLPQGMEFNMIKVKGGKFLMGDESEEAYDDEKPIHGVEVSDFYLGQYQVTQELWQLVMKKNPASFPGFNHPIETISWYDAVLFCNRLSEMQGYSLAYEIDQNTKDPNNINPDDDVKWFVKWNKSANGYRLPTESEWEFAARGGIYGKGCKYAGSNDLNEVGWYGFSKNSHKTTQKVGMKIPNELGLFDMSGNVYEWCWDWFGDYPEHLLKDTQGSESGRYRVLRGGSWGRDPHRCRVSDRDDVSPHNRFNIRGLRLSRTAL